MKLLKEFKEFNYEIIKEDAVDGRPGKLFVKGVFSVQILLTRTDVSIQKIFSSRK
jgi:hypothetical protein